MTPAELEGLYRAEGVHFGEQPTVPTERHVLEGGDTLVCPQPGTAGFARLFGQLHGPYQPHSDLVRGVAASLQAPGPRVQAAAAQAAPAPP
jgi:hypothetical protein